jgi:hypothetical protein
MAMSGLPENNSISPILLLYKVELADYYYYYYSSTIPQLLK